MSGQQEWEKWTDAEPVTDDMMLEQFLPLCGYMARQASRTYGLREEDVEDIVQSMTLALLALPAEKRAYTGYCKAVLNNALRDAIAETLRRGAKPHAKWKDNLTTDYLSVAPSEDGDDDVTAALDRLAGTGIGEDLILTRIALREAIDALPPLEREAIIMAYQYGYFHYEIAEHQGISLATVNYRIQKAIATLKARLT